MAGLRIRDIMGFTTICRYSCVCIYANFI
nr:hypothetical protein [Parageobacillus caldoxylosilyticus]